MLQLRVCCLVHVLMIVLRLGVSSTFNLDLWSVQRTRPDLNAFHHWINEYMHHKEDSSIQGELFDESECLSYGRN